MMRSIDYRKFLDRNLIGQMPLIGGGLSLLVSDGVYRGAYLEELLAGLLAELGVRTFGDLRTGEEPDQFAWSLVVTASDLSRRRLVRIPWDLESYGIDPDGFSVARAVHASAAIPYIFEPVRVRGTTWVDGGLLSDFPVDLFDRPDPQWPTFGIRLSARPGIPPTHPVHGPVSLGIAAIETLVSNQDNAYIDDPCTVDAPSSCPPTRSARSTSTSPPTNARPSTNEDCMRANGFCRRGITRTTWRLAAARGIARRKASNRAAMPIRARSRSHQVDAGHARCHPATAFG